MQPAIAWRKEIMVGSFEQDEIRMKFAGTRKTHGQMLFIEKEVPYLAFRTLLSEPEVRHGCATRLGGVSEGCFASLNLGFFRGHSEEKVRENFCRICDSIGVDVNKVVLPKQVHECNVRRVTEEDFGNGIVRPLPYDSVDAQVTNVRGAVLAVFGADCVPILFYDPAGHAIGTAHAGWRGSIGRIAQKTVETMTREFGTDPKQIKACIGPSICGECYEVDGIVLRRFSEEFPEAVTACGQGKGLLNLWKVNETVLLQAGLLPEHITVSGVCTKCNSDVFFSHRVMGERRGNLACFISLAEEK